MTIKIIKINTILFIVFILQLNARMIIIFQVSNNNTEGRCHLLPSFSLSLCIIQKGEKGVKTRKSDNKNLWKLSLYFSFIHTPVECEGEKYESKLNKTIKLFLSLALVLNLIRLIKTHKESGVNGEQREGASCCGT